jgi:hypothetical protein
MSGNYCRPVPNRRIALFVYINMFILRMIYVISCVEVIKHMAWTTEGR